MPDILFLSLILLGCVFGYYLFVKPIGHILDILEAIGESSRTFQEIKQAIGTDEKTLSLALSLMKKPLALIQHPEGRQESYMLTDAGHHELRRSRH
jgi:DNA-binding transcriptional regulator PaaX